jgi:hypothetical protein
LQADVARQIVRALMDIIRVTDEARLVWTHKNTPVCGALKGDVLEALGQKSVWDITPGLANTASAGPPQARLRVAVHHRAHPLPPWCAAEWMGKK